MTRAQEMDSSGADAPSRYLRLAWTLTTRVVTYIKAVGSVVLIAGSTLTSTYGLADVKGFVRDIVGESNVVLPSVIAGVTVFYLLMTLALKLPKGFSNNIKQNDGE
jgi:small-conductance mechanosensitive channel